MHFVVDMSNNNVYNKAIDKRIIYKKRRYIFYIAW